MTAPYHADTSSRRSNKCPVIRYRLPRVCPAYVRSTLEVRHPEVSVSFRRGSGERVPSWVSAVNADGNEVAGISMPDVTYPVASHSGFLSQGEKNGAAGELLSTSVSGVSSPEDRVRATIARDPRPSITERYESKERYLEAIELAAESLVGRRYLLAEDIALCIELARRRYDAVMEPG